MPTKAFEKNQKTVKSFSLNGFQFVTNLYVKMAKSWVFHEFSKISVDIGNFYMEKLNC